MITGICFQQLFVSFFCIINIIVIHGQLITANTLPQTRSRLKAEFGSKMHENSFGHELSKQINNLIIGRNVVSGKMAKRNSFTNIVIIQFNVLVAGMKNWINSHVKSVDIVTV